MKLPGPTHNLRIGLLGGSFNPAHSGHLHVAETAMRRLHLDWVWWIVARGNPLKSSHGDYAARLASAAAITATHPRMRVSDIEAQAGLTYTVDLLDILDQRAPDARFVWLMGGDNLAGFQRWKDWDEIARRVSIAIIARPGAHAPTLRSKLCERFAEYRVPAAQAAALPRLSAPRWTYLPAPFNPASSTAIRAAGKAKIP